MYILSNGDMRDLDDVRLLSKGPYQVAARCVVRATRTRHLKATPKPFPQFCVVMLSAAAQLRLNLLRGALGCICSFICLHPNSTHRHDEKAKRARTSKHNAR